jgi:hypothetical protein
VARRYLRVPRVEIRSARRHHRTQPRCY